MTITNRDVDRFMALFSGYEKAYGQYLVKGANDSGKVLGKPTTVRGEPGPTLYREHLEGIGAGLGIIMLREDNTCLFGAIDFDKKNMDHVAAEQRVRELGLPLVLCRSKSGGGHFYVFLEEPVEAATLRDRLSEWTALLGLARNTEQFPKQSSRYDETDVGNWINIPYFGAESTTRYAVINGVPATLEQFLDYAESQRVPADVITRSTTEESVLFEEGPPCLQTLEAQGGFIEGTKKDGMFSVVVYLKKRYPDDWEERVDGYNRAMANIRSDEIQTLIKSNKKKDYEYKCRLAPLNAVCNRRLCKTRDFGVGEVGGADHAGTQIGSLTRYESPHGDEPLFAMEVNGRRVLVTTAQFYSRDEFNRACMSQANALPIHMPPAKWLKVVHEMLTTVDVVPLPEDASPTGQLWEHIIAFLTQQVMATEREKVTLGQPYRCVKCNKVYFRSVDLFGYLDSKRVPYKTPQMVWELLRKRGSDKTFFNIRGRGVNVWYLPAPKTETPKDLAPIEDSGTEAF